MKHLGDITKINGAEIEPVDVICFGSPCQDLSVAGLRNGLSGERSGLFMDAVRIIKEMRDADRKRLQVSGSDVDIRLLRPRFAIWENVPGAFSSNNGEDFRVVLEELAHVIDKDVAIPKPKEKWKPSGLIIGDNWSIAWRTMDAQYWGVPQRRKRIALVLDCAGECAGEILFESESVSGNTEPSIEAWQGVAKCPSGSIGECGIESNTLKIRGGAK